MAINGGIGCMLLLVHYVRWGENFMNVQNAHVNVHVVYPIFDLADIPSRSVSRYGLTSALRLSYSPAKQGELTPTLGSL